MNDKERELDFALAEAEQENRLLRARNERLERELATQLEACAEKAGEFARKWWSIHCDSNKHMETTKKAHDDFCALQAAIRARGQG